MTRIFSNLFREIREKRWYTAVYHLFYCVNSSIAQIIMGFQEVIEPFAFFGAHPFGQFNWFVFMVDEELVIARPLVAQPQRRYLLKGQIKPLPFLENLIRINTL